jgi:hypothetical protein
LEIVEKKNGTDENENYSHTVTGYESERPVTQWFSRYNDFRDLVFFDEVESS